MSVAVSNFGAEWLVGGNVLCNVLMECYRCFFLYMYQITITTNRSKVEGFTFRVLGLGV